MKPIICITLLVLVFCISFSSECDKKCCCCGSGKYKKVPLYELHNPTTGSWFYTTTVKEVNHAVKNRGFVRTRVIGEVAVSSKDCDGGKSLIPIYRLYNNKTSDYLYKTKKDESHKCKLTDFESEGIKFYAAATAKKCDATVPLYRFWTGKFHIYDTDLKEGKLRCGPKCDPEGVIGYIWPPGNKPPTETPTTTTEVPTTTTTETPTTTTTETPTTTTTETPTTTTPRPNITPPSECTMNFARLFRLYNRVTDSHLYTISYDEALNAYQALNYDPEKPPGRVTKDASDCWCTKELKPVYRLDKPGPIEDHLYTVSSEEAANAVSKLGYTDKGIAYYCSKNSAFCGATLPLHRYVKSNQAHFYTIDLEEGKQNVISKGGTYEGILCYIWPDA